MVLRMSRPNSVAGCWQRPARGVALLEVLVAMMILAVGATAIVAVSAETGRALAHARHTEHEVRGASALLDAVALWPREDLDRHLGITVQGPWRMSVSRTMPLLYTVLITDSGSRREILRTALYRALPPDSSKNGTESVR